MIRPLSRVGYAAYHMHENSNLKTFNSENLFAISIIKHFGSSISSKPTFNRNVLQSKLRTYFSFDYILFYNWIEPVICLQTIQR